MTDNSHLTSKRMQALADASLESPRGRTLSVGKVRHHMQLEPCIGWPRVVYVAMLPAAPAAPAAAPALDTRAEGTGAVLVPRAPTLSYF